MGRDAMKPPPISLFSAAIRLILLLLYCVIELKAIGWMVRHSHWPLTDSAVVAIWAGIAVAPLVIFSRYYHAAYCPAVMWLGYAAGHVIYFGDRWVLERGFRGVWTIHQVSSPFLRIIARQNRVSQWKSFTDLADDLHAGRKPSVRAIRLPAGFCSRSQLRRLGFNVVPGRIPLVARVIRPLFFDEFRYRQKLLRTRHNPDPGLRVAGVMSREAFVSRYARALRR